MFIQNLSQTALQVTYKNLYLSILLVIVAMLAVGCGSGNTVRESETNDALDSASVVTTTPEEVVQAAADAFVEGYNNRDASVMLPFFTTGEDAVEEGLAETLRAAENQINSAPEGMTVGIERMNMLDTRVDEANNAAVVRYDATVVFYQDGDLSMTFQVEQDVALDLIDDTWFISGGEQPQTMEGGQDFGIEDDAAIEQP